MTDDAVPSLLAGLVDDAGLFPPEELKMPAAVARHRRDEAVGSPVLSGRFVCPAARLAELLAELAPAEGLRLALVTPLEAGALHASLDRIRGDSRVTLAGVEGPLGEIAALAEVPDGVPCYAEIPVTGAWQGPLGDIAAAGRAAKARCGGLRAELFPTAAQLGEFVHACAQANVPFKATAGLHHALPYTDERTGFGHHGFLNLLLAACRAADGAAAGDVAAVLRVTDAAALVAEVAGTPPDLAARARALFTGYGSCSTSEPAEDLRTLGLLGGAGRMTATEVTG
ncbi:MAG TPA: hypothetical protein VGL63_08515 [Streptosporangiaceae bacterium]